MDGKRGEKAIGSGSSANGLLPKRYEMTTAAARVGRRRLLRPAFLE